MKNHVSTLFVLIASWMLMSVAHATPIDEMPSGTYELDPAHTSVHWKVSHMGLSYYTARFTKHEATLEFNAEKPEKSTLEVTIYPDSIKTDYPFVDEKDFDKKLAFDEKWFNANVFPTITFKSSDVEKLTKETGKVTGELTMLGKTKPITMDVRFNGAFKNKPFANVPALGFSASFEMMRSDWGLDSYIPNIGDRVIVMIETELHKKRK